MSLTRDPTIRELNDCGCCEGSGLSAPEVIDNRPGLSAVAYRIGTHSRFKESMLARLSAVDMPALDDLTTRADGDFSVAILDAWAAVADVITFYQERIANESYVRTATERRSLVELAKLVGYVSRPGVAASAYLAFTLDDPGVPADIPVPVGTKVQSIPGPGEKPQVFETIEEIEGRPEWNAMKAIKVRKHPALTPETQTVTVRGTATNVQKGDSLLLLCGAGAANRAVKRVVNVVADTTAQTTRIDLVTVPPEPPTFHFLPLLLAVWSATPVKMTTASVKTNVLSGSWKHADLKAYATVQKWPIKQLSVNIATLARIALRLTPPETGVFAFRQRAAAFGHNAPKYTSLPDPKPSGGSWEGVTLASAPGGSSKKIDLDNVYPGIVDDSWLVLRNELNETRVFQVTGYSELTRADYTLSTKVSRIELDRNTDFGMFSLRNTTVLAQSEKLDLAELPIVDVVKGNRLVLDRPYLGLTVGRPVIVTGERTDLDGVIDSEVMTLAEVTLSGGYTELVFVTALANEYERASVTVNGNVALATHGETKSQALGSGDGNVPFQRFALPELPLTHVAADNAKGAASTLEVRVNEVLWQEVDFFYGRGPDDRVYVTRTDDEGRTSVQFGDGRTGARVPTGQENVRVRYRKGMGSEGLVSEEQLTLLMTRPLGVRGVTNPVAAGDAAPAESLVDVRRNAALPIRSLDRIVSLRDYEDFARAFSGVAKALATWTWNGHHRGVFVTVAGVGGRAIAEGSLTYKNLLSAMFQAGDPAVSVRVKSYTPAFFRLAGNLGVDPAYQTGAVLAAVDAALRVAFSFDAREFGQPVAKSEVIAAIQAVNGVLAVDLNDLHRVDATAEQLAVTTLFDRLAARVPSAGTNVTVAAELLLLDPRPVELGVMTT
jgi:predicted phage baseplate assembly protein